MKSHQGLLGLMLIFLVLVASDYPLFAINGQSNRATLKGLKGVGVLVENLSSEVEKEGLKKNGLQLEVEFKLREAGIKVLSKEESLKTPGEPYLYINVNMNTAKTESDIYPYSIDMLFIQKVSLLRNPQQVTYAVTWSTGGVGSITKQLVSRLRSSVSDMVDIFIKAYLAENPK
jgi:Cdc6-like AAA superfamily ATPase